MRIFPLVPLFISAWMATSGCAVFAPGDAPDTPLATRPGAPGRAMAGAPNAGWKPFASSSDDAVSVVPSNTSASESASAPATPAAAVKSSSQTASNGPAATSLLGLPALTQVVRIASAPAGAAVSLNGKLIGVTPLEVNLDMYDSYVLTLTLAGYQDYTETLQAYTEGKGSASGKAGMAVANIRHGFASPLNITLTPRAH